MIKYSKNKIKNDKYYKMIFPIFQNVYLEYEKLLTAFSYKKYKISKNEMVYKIENDLIVYIGLKYNTYIMESFEYSLDIDWKDFNYDFFNKDITSLFEVYIEELTENTLFKFNKTQFCEHCNQTQHFLKLQTFQGNQHFSQNLEHVDKKLPKLHLKNRFNTWPGWNYYFIVFEIFDSQGDKSFGVWHTTDKNIHISALKKCTKISSIIFETATINNYNLLFSTKDAGIMFDIKFKNVATKIVYQDLKTEFYENINYIILQENIKQKNLLSEKSKEILKNATNGNYDNFEKGSYIQPLIKWKSEYLVKTICEKIYGINNVIYQYKPYFLHSKSGQLSYDIFLPRLKVAIEYQGKQHFEKVDFFGGEESFLKQQQRDLLKKELSRQNNIKLIYINYWEEITEDLIKNKIKNTK